MKTDIRIANLFTGQISQLAMLVMLACVLLPSAFYSYHLKDPTPSELLIAICIGVFSSVVFLWIDSVSVLTFRSPWVSRSIYGVAISSILGISVGVYKDAFAESKYPYEGRWSLVIYDQNFERPLVNRIVALVYSKQSENYWGYSDYDPKAEKGMAVWVSIDDLSVTEQNVTATWYDRRGKKYELVHRARAQRNEVGERVWSCENFIDAPDLLNNRIPSEGALLNCWPASSIRRSLFCLLPG